MNQTATINSSQVASATISVDGGPATDYDGFDVGVAGRTVNIWESFAADEMHNINSQREDEPVRSVVIVADLHDGSTVTFAS